MFVRILRLLGLLPEIAPSRPTRTSSSLLRDIIRPTGVDIRCAIDDLNGWAETIEAIESYVTSEIASPTSRPSEEISVPGTKKQLRFALEIVDDSLTVLFSGTSQAGAEGRYRVRLYP